MSLKFGFGGPNKKPSSQAKKPVKKAATAFALDEDDNDVPTKDASDAPSKSSKKAKPSISQYGDLATQQTYRKNVDKALEVDSSIYDYDAAWDAIKAREEAKKAADKAEAEKGKSKYMENLLAAKDVREKDYLKAKEKKYQREREAEGDEFDDKEKFVTGAYKKQQEDLRHQEEVERLKEETEKKKREKDGKRDFLNRLLEQGDRKHQDNVAAAAEGDKTGALPMDKEEKKSEVDIAKELNAKGANIALTDDGEVADKRELLTAGLNIMARPKSKSVHQNRPAVLNSTGLPLGKPANSRAARERQSRMLEDQLEQMVKRQAENEAEELHRQERAAKSQKTAEDRNSARERYLARKKAASSAAASAVDNATS
jgi:coiled-coil domain-containing protein 55